MTSSMFAAGDPAPLLDYFRVPYTRDGEAAREEAIPLARLTWRENGAAARTLFWPAAAAVEPAALHRLGSIAVFAGVARDDATARPLAAVGGRWSRLVPLRDSGGSPIAWVQADGDGNVYLPFDPAQASRLLLTEQYRDAPARRAAVRAYYAARRILPRRVQVALRRRLTSIQSRVAFPAWPVESSLHDLYDLVLGLLAHLAQAPVPCVAPWPRGRSWALVLTHDVETLDGYANLDRLRDVEHALGLRSAWNFVPKRYQVDDGVVRGLRDAGHEVGVHGLYHDGRDLESRGLLERRLPEIRAAAHRWQAAGFRAPALRRNLELMPLLGFDYDSSYPDTDPHGPDGGGCCSWLPFDLDGLVELPVTLPQDHTVFEILGYVDGRVWRDKTEQIRRRHGMALLITHPDYMLSDRPLEAYRRYVEEFAADDSAWHALPHEVSGWWRRRAAARLVHGESGWAIEGAAAGEAALGFVEPRTLEEILADAAGAAR